MYSQLVNFQEIWIDVNDVISSSVVTNKAALFATLIHMDVNIILKENYQVFNNLNKYIKLIDWTYVDIRIK